jgi:D-alanyl-D-alanine carboxypeptidase (penicillin-binding protein 5/6)
MAVAASGSSEKEFIKLINARLKNWGADNTKITDVTGLDEKNKSTARDLLKIFTKALGNKNIKDALGKTNFVFYGINKQNKKVKHSVASTNQLINKSGRNYRIIASKTGYTDEAGSCLIMLIESRKTKKQFIVLTLGDANYAKRFDEVNKIAQWVSSNDISIASK